MALSKSSQRADEGNWMSFSDIMTGLMVIFMFIAISYILEVKNQQNEINDLFEEFRLTKQELYGELDSTFASEISSNQVILDKDLSIKFVNTEVLFDRQEATIKPEFALMLDDFIPKYIEIITKPKYKDKISEVKIEGHASRNSGSQYFFNLELSQERANNVLLKVLQNPAFLNLNPEIEERVRFWFSSSGYSYSRNVDENYSYTIDSKMDLDPYKSRRVEFRIVTSSEKLVEKVLTKIDAQ